MGLSFRCKHCGRSIHPWGGDGWRHARGRRRALDRHRPEPEVDDRRLRKGDLGEMATPDGIFRGIVVVSGRKWVTLRVGRLDVQGRREDARHATGLSSAEVVKILPTARYTIASRATSLDQFDRERYRAESEARL